MRIRYPPVAPTVTLEAAPPSKLNATLRLAEQFQLCVTRTIKADFLLNRPKERQRWMGHVVLQDFQRN